MIMCIAIVHTSVVIHTTIVVTLSSIVSSIWTPSETCCLIIVAMIVALVVVARTILIPSVVMSVPTLASPLKSLILSWSRFHRLLEVFELLLFLKSLF